MKITKIICDGCGGEITGLYGSCGVYSIIQVSLGGGMWGDPRVSSGLDYCNNCFDVIYEKLPKYER